MPPPLAEAVQGEEAGTVAEVMEEAVQGSGQERDCDHGATPLELVGEKQLVRGHEPLIAVCSPAAKGRVSCPVAIRDDRRARQRDRGRVSCHWPAKTCDPPRHGGKV